MNADGFMVLVVVAGLLLIVLGLIVLEARRSARELRKNASAEMNEIRNAVNALQVQVAEIKQSAAQLERTPQPFAPAALTAEQRAVALSMLRSGIGSEVVRSALHLPLAETSLLQKVESLLASTSVQK